MLLIDKPMPNPRSRASSELNGPSIFNALLSAAFSSSSLRISSSRSEAQSPGTFKLLGAPPALEP